MKKTYRWTNRITGTRYDYIFVDNICIGFFRNGKEIYPEKNRGKVLSKQLQANMEPSGFTLSDYE